MTRRDCLGEERSRILRVGGSPKSEVRSRGARACPQISPLGSPNPMTSPPSKPRRTPQNESSRAPCSYGLLSLWSQFAKINHLGSPAPVDCPLWSECMPPSQSCQAPDSYGLPCPCPRCIPPDQSFQVTYSYFVPRIMGNICFWPLFEP